MTKRYVSRLYMITVVAVVASLALGAYGQQKPEQAKAPDAAVTLAYQFPERKALSYKHTSSETQNLEIQGQSITTQSQSSIEFTTKQKSAKEGQFTLGVTVDAMEAGAQSQQGNFTADTSAIVGKSFDMVVTRLGKEIDTSAAAALKFDMGGTGQRDLSAHFQAFFPDLPDRPVKVGDTWPSEDTVTQKVGSGQLRIVAKNTHTLDGFETVDGYECARIKTVGKGTMTGNIEQGGVGISFDSAIEGTDTWYFAIKEGLLVKSDSKSSVNGTLYIGEPANMNVPLSGESTGQVRLVKK